MHLLLVTNSSGDSNSRRQTTNTDGSYVTDTIQPVITVIDASKHHCMETHDIRHYNGANSITTATIEDSTYALVTAPIDTKASKS